MIKRDKIYNLYWYFAYERQNIFLKKKEGLPAPWTNDPILQTYKFCNSYRVNDRVSQYLLKNVIYNGKKYSDEDMIFRIILFKIFNKESTWEYLLEELGDITLSNFSFEKYSKVLTELIESGIAIYNDAYISCANKVYGYAHKHDNHLKLLETFFIKDKAHLEIISAKDMGEGFKVLNRYPLIGDFMAYQLITDINYSEVVDFSEGSFTIAGPGAKRGINKCFKDKGDMSNEDIIKYMYDNQDKEFKRLGLNFERIGDRPLQYIDCQNIFCELDKYCREKVPELTSNRTKIKKKYHSKSNLIDYFYPPKWNIK